MSQLCVLPCAAGQRQAKRNEVTLRCLPGLDDGGGMDDPWQQVRPVARGKSTIQAAVGETGPAGARSAWAFLAPALLFN
jgi:hypothetical protein